MWFIRRHRRTTVCSFVLVVLFSMGLYITFYVNKFIEIFRDEPFDVIVEGDNPVVDYLNVRLDLTADQPTCQPHDYLMIYILSTITNTQRRNVIRSTWGSKRNGTCFIFIIGDVEGVTPDAGEIQMNINDERRQHHDIVQINHIESYPNVIYKEVAALSWSTAFYPNIPYLFKTDDDLIVDTILLSFIAKLLLTNITTDDTLISKYGPTLISNIISSDRATFFRSAWPAEFQETIRGSGKYGINETIWPHKFLPPYCSGFGWFMSKQVRDRLVKASYTYPLSKVPRIGDVFASGFLAKAANVKCTGIPIDYEQPSTDNCSCLMANNPLLAVCASPFHSGAAKTEEQKYNSYRKAWQVIQLRYNLTNTITIDC